MTTPTFAAIAALVTLAIVLLIAWISALEKRTRIRNEREAREWRECEDRVARNEKVRKEKVRDIKSWVYCSLCGRRNLSFLSIKAGRGLKSYLVFRCNDCDKVVDFSVSDYLIVAMVPGAKSTAEGWQIHMHEVILPHLRKMFPENNQQDPLCGYCGSTGNHCPDCGAVV